VLVFHYDPVLVYMDDCDYWASPQLRAPIMGTPGKDIFFGHMAVRNWVLI